MFCYLARWEHIWGPLRLFRYLTLRCFLALAFALILGFYIGPRLIRFLRQFKLAQALRQASEVGLLAELHAGKGGTPTMGGLMIYASVMLACLFFAQWNLYVVVALLVYTVLTLIGFLDDYLKVTRKNSRGLPGTYKMIGQAFLCFVVLYLFLNVDPLVHSKMSELWVPFLKTPIIDWMPIGFIFIFFFLVMAGSSNAINLTDGVDGLAIGCTITVALIYAIMAYLAGNVITAQYLFLGYVPGVEELAVVCMAVVGASLAFLWYNAHPAEVFMGDTGSLALGGLIGSIAFMVQQPFTLVIVGGVFVMEAVSVIVQVGSFKLFKRRVFRMAPIHHHFELQGLKETKVVVRFWILSLLFGLIGLSTLKLR